MVFQFYFHLYKIEIADHDKSAQELNDLDLPLSSGKNAEIN